MLDGHHRLRACKELRLPVTYSVKDFTGKPMEELKYVVAVNLHRRHLDQFQRAEIGLKMDKIARTIAKERQQASRFTAETGKAWQSRDSTVAVISLAKSILLYTQQKACYIVYFMYYISSLNSSFISRAFRNILCYKDSSRCIISRNCDPWMFKGACYVMTSFTVLDSPRALIPLLI